VNDYYRAVSYGNLDIVAVNLPSALGWVRADSAYSYYVNGDNGVGPYPTNTQKLVEELVYAVDPFIDFSKYDNDGDNLVDALFVVHAGPGAEFTLSDDDIWSHAWATSYMVPTDNQGTKVFSYTIEPEYWLKPGDMTIGVFAHELGHTLFDLPDLYDRDNPESDDASSGLDEWSLMAAGSWLGPAGQYMYMGTSPAYPDAWSRARMGYASVVNISADVFDQPIVDAVAASQVYRLWINGIQGEEYFLIENRRRAGYDTYLPGEGLLIYHVDERQLYPSNEPPLNNNEWYPGHTDQGNYLVALEQADGLYELEQNDWADSGDPFPGSSLNRNFYGFSAPSSRTYSGSFTGVGVTNISAAGDTMWADLFVTPSQDSI
ncbi:MAG: M6 family metalloprotease domain-containing protein, partial [Fidelibacterota bacterium]